jgi:hypothetical protein
MLEVFPRKIFLTRLHGWNLSKPGNGEIIKRRKILATRFPRFIKILEKLFSQLL